MNSLRQDKSIKILPADKGHCAVVLNTEDYMSKCQDLLNDTNTYVKLPRDPTNMYKKQLVDTLKEF